MAPKAPPPQPASQPQTVNSQRTTPTAPPTRQKTPEKARVPSQDTSNNVNTVIDLTEDTEETSGSQASGRKPSGAGPPPLLKAVVEPSPAPNTIAPSAQARPTSQVRPFNNAQQPVPTAVSANSSRNISEVVQAIVNSTRTIQAPPNFRTVTTSVQQVGQNPLHALPPTAPTYQRPPLQVPTQVLTQVPTQVVSSVGYVGGQPVVPQMQQTTGTFRPPVVTTSTYVVQPSHVVESVLSPPVMCMPPSQPGNPLYSQYTQPQRLPVQNVGVPPARHPMPTVPPYRQPFHSVPPPTSLMQAPRPAGPAVMSRPAPPPLLHNNAPQVQQMRPPMQPAFPPRPPLFNSSPNTPPPKSAPCPPPPASPPPQHVPPNVVGLPLPHRTTLHIARAGNGIVLSWNVTEPPNPRSPAVDCYQLFAYQEGTGQPNTALWKKIGDVKALPLPMACTLTQFLPGSTYHFAVRAMDVYGRVGPFSAPCSIELSSA
ncbi:PREDICTED: activating transcription factor 7-interacting protein 1-like [Branchiostoma belcheri]|uniref:Activating transcription factor 7-interacting protein 1-like n=1 Tax=Branchiostoma belcheri TaxID=7741 RepID=A0A6P4XRN8_BRABE|nr:PREDICTED: activating transcription factor 7-interacting protein 1-like [Branchiostoma belcheri]